MRIAIADFSVRPTQPNVSELLFSDMGKQDACKLCGLWARWMGRPPFSTWPCGRMQHRCSRCHPLQSIKQEFTAKEKAQTVRKVIAKAKPKSVKKANAA